LRREDLRNDYIENDFGPPSTEKIRMPPVRSGPAPDALTHATLVATMVSQGLRMIVRYLNVLQQELPGKIQVQMTQTFWLERCAAAFELPTRGLYALSCQSLE